MNLLKQYQKIILIGTSALCAGGLLSAGLALAEPIIGLSIAYAYDGGDYGADSGKDRGKGCFEDGQKVKLTQTNRDCNGNVQGTLMTESFGFAFISPTDSKLAAGIVLEDATADATYRIRLIQTKNGQAIGDQCTDYEEATLITDEDGNGSAFVLEKLKKGANDAFVVLNNEDDPNDFYTTKEVWF